MYAVFQLSGYQYTGEEGAVLRVPKQNVEKGNSFDIGEVRLHALGKFRRVLAF